MRREKYYNPESEHHLDRAEQESFHERIKSTLTERVYNDLRRIIDGYYGEPSESGIETRSDQEIVTDICEAIKDDPEKLEAVIAYCKDEPNGEAGSLGLLEVLERLSIDLVKERHDLIEKESR